MDKDYYLKIPSKDPLDPSKCSYRVIRGGAWVFDARYCRTARRSRGVPGYRIVYLGPDMPFAELGLTARRAGCHAIVISGSVNPAQQSLYADMRQLVSAADCPVFVGGQTSVHQHDAIEHAGASPLGTDIRNSIRRMTQSLELLK